MDHVRQLLGACEHGDVQAVQTLLNEGVEVDSVGDEENTPLQVASANGHENVVCVLLMAGAALDKTNLFGWTALMQAARHGHCSVVSLLLQHKAEIGIRNRYGATVLTLAARGGHLPVVRLLMEAGVDLNASGSSCEFIPLLSAAQQGHDTVLRFLLDRGCEVNYKTSSTGLTPLMLTALNGHMTSAQILIERGCDPNVTNVDAKTALEIASIRGRREVRGYLDRKTTNKPEIIPIEVKPDIIEAVKQGDIYRVRDILEEDNSRVDASSPQDGATPLMFAAMTGRLDIAQFLVERGCDINKQDSISGWTALMQATYHGKKNVAMFLITIGADVSIQAKNGCTAFDMASLIDDVDTELLRVLASKVMHISRVEKGKKFWSKQSAVLLMQPFPHDHMIEDQPKSGLKAWWSRMSNRFRNLKLGRTFQPNRLAPMPSPLESIATSPDLKAKSSINSPVLKKKNHYTEAGLTASSLPSFDIMTAENKKSLTMYTLDINPPHSTVISETLKPVIPPFLPAPSFALDITNRTRKVSNVRQPSTSQSIDSGNSMIMSSRPKLRPMKFLQNVPSSNLSSSPVSPSGSVRIPGQPSPSSSGEYTQNGLGLPGIQPHTSRSNTFAASHHPSRLFMPRKSTTIPYAFKMASNTTSPNSSTSGSSSITPQRSTRSRNTSSKGSTTSTLTPSPSPTPGKHAEESNPALGSLHEQDGTRDEELSGILRKLSLEKYQPIFEEQEVDMEAFLTLTEDDLKELGISHSESRHQILSTISELNTGKGETAIVDTLTSFQTTLKARIPSETGSNGAASLMSWNIQAESDPANQASKSRSS
ncbi:hypothetical protein ScPMuIL_000491 [Solemya velum]